MSEISGLSFQFKKAEKDEPTKPEDSRRKEAIRQKGKIGGVAQRVGVLLFSCEGLSSSHQSTPPQKRGSKQMKQKTIR
jgi:hypothetical protein